MREVISQHLEIKRKGAAISIDVQNQNPTDNIVEETFVVDEAGNVVRK